MKSKTTKFEHDNLPREEVIRRLEEMQKGYCHRFWAGGNDHNAVCYDNIIKLLKEPYHAI